MATSRWTITREDRIFFVLWLVFTVVVVAASLLTDGSSPAITAVVLVTFLVFGAGSLISWLREEGRSRVSEPNRRSNRRPLVRWLLALVIFVIWLVVFQLCVGSLEGDWTGPWNAAWAIWLGAWLQSTNLLERALLGGSERSGSTQQDLSRLADPVVHS